jgi:hypothetical protein
MTLPVLSRRVDGGDGVNLSEGEPGERHQVSASARERVVVSA